MRKPDPQTQTPPPAAGATSHPRFSEHRAAPASANPAAKSAENGATPKSPPAPAPTKKSPKEIGGPKGPEPTRYGDWERDGRCVDF